MSKECARHTREAVLAALAAGREKIRTYIRVRKPEDIRSSKEYSAIFGLLRAFARKENEFLEDTTADDISLEELFPSRVSSTAAQRLREVASVSTVQELLDANPFLVRMALTEEVECLRESIIQMILPTAAMSYTDYLSHLERNMQQFIV